MLPQVAEAATRTESANNTVLVAGQTGSIVDDRLNVWTIVNGVVKKNGANAGYSARVIQLAYVNDVVWQENADHLWWSWNGSSWDGGWGIPTSPLPQNVSSPSNNTSLTESANNSVLLAGQTGSLVDRQKDVWTIVNGVVKKNNVSAGYSARVIQLAYVNGVIWQENADHLWWSWNGSSWDGGWGIPTSPLSTAVTAPAPQPQPEPEPAPAPAPTNSSNPFAGQTLYRSSWSNALNQANAWRSTRPDDAAKMDYLAAQPTARWFGDWNANIQSDVSAYVGEAAAANALPVLVLYNIPFRDCGSYSAGGAGSASGYHDWIVKVAEGIGTRKAMIVLEPDATSLDCFDDTRAAMLADAVNVLEAKPNVAVYIDAGHPDWVPAATMATRLQKSGIQNAQGMALNVSNFYSTDSNMAYGNDLSSRLGGKHYIIDTARNHNGWQGEWCNPQGAGIGKAPTTNTGSALFDAGLWIKPPGESDGPCNGGPGAGSWWADYALKLYNQGTH
uniref:Glucanase n=1 Tax=uncultured Parcubacteria group bacterium TaxID=221218 RepID=A0A481MY79_9BACT|nr:Endoglucanase [uncultured Parcubacteria group bacterium]